MDNFLRYLFLFLLGAAGIFIGYLLAVRHKLKKMREAYDGATVAAESRKKEFRKKVLDFLEENNKIDKEAAASVLEVEAEVADKYLSYLKNEEILREKEAGVFVKK